MSKKEKIMIAVMIGSVVCWIGGTGFVLYAAQNHMDDIVSEVESLEKDYQSTSDELQSTQEQLDEANTKNRKLKKKLAKQIEASNGYHMQLKDAQAKIKELETSIESTAIEAIATPVAIETPIPQETLGVTQPGNEFSDGRCYMGIDGEYLEPMSGRVQIYISGIDPYTYAITIHGSGGAAYSSDWNLTSTWDASSSSLVYTGTRTDTENGIVTTYDNITGSLRFIGDSILYWTDPGTENINRGPFEKQN